MKTTLKEQQILWATFNNEYAAGDYTAGTWTFAVIDNSEIPRAQARGVISSLIKKGLLIVEDTEGKNRNDDMACYRTEAGNEQCRLLGIGVNTVYPLEVATEEPVDEEKLTQVLIEAEKIITENAGPEDIFGYMFIWGQLIIGTHHLRRCLGYVCTKSAGFIKIKNALEAVPEISDVWRNLD